MKPIELRKFPMPTVSISKAVNLPETDEHLPLRGIGLLGNETRSMHREKSEVPLGQRCEVPATGDDSTVPSKVIVFPLSFGPTSCQARGPADTQPTKATEMRRICFMSANA